VLRVLEEPLDEGHHMTIGNMSDQAAYLFRAGQLVESEAHIDRAVKLAREYLEKLDPVRSSVFSNAAAIYRELGRYRLARELSLGGLDSVTFVKRADNPETLSAMMEYSRPLLHNGELQTGHEIMQICIRRTKQEYGAGHQLKRGRVGGLANVEDWLSTCELSRRGL